MKTRFLRKAVCVLLVCALTVGAVFPAFAGTPAEDAHLHFNKDGKFRILNFSDFQDDATLDDRVKDFIPRAVYAAQPDLIVLTGDNIYGNVILLSDNTRVAIAEFMDIFQTLGVPVAIVFGNHDDSGNALSKEKQMQIYNSYSVSISHDEGSDLDGCGTYNVPIYGSTETDKVKFNLWMFDTGSSTTLSGYDHMRDSQLNWYVSKSNELKKANGGKLVPSIAFQHIIVKEIFDALNEATILTPGAVRYNLKYYVLPETAAPGSVLNEHPCPSTSGDEFSVVRQQGDVLAIVSGHDHKNCFIVPYMGIDLINTPGVGFYSYGDDALRGARIIDIDEQTGTYSTEMLILADLAQTQTYAPTGAALNSLPLREARFRANERLKHAETVFSTQSLTALEEALAQADAILRDLDDDRKTSAYDQSAIDQAASRVNTCVQNLETASIRVTFDANGGTCAVQDQTYLYGAACGSLPQATRGRYVLDGWFTQPKGGEQITEHTQFTTADDRIWYAQWSADTDWLPGDADQDNSVDLRDVTVLQRWLAGGWDAQLEFDHADVNADGKLDLRDVMLLRRYLAGGWNVVLV